MARRQQEVSGMTTQSNFMACKYRQVRFVINQGDLTLASLMTLLKSTLAYLYQGCRLRQFLGH